jgi:hypothetical protein
MMMDIDDRIKEIKLSLKEEDLKRSKRNDLKEELESLYFKKAKFHFKLATEGLIPEIKEALKDELTDDKFKNALVGFVDLIKMGVNAQAEKLKMTIQHDLNLLKEQQRIQIKDVNLRSKDLIETFKAKYIAEADIMFADASLTETRTFLLKKIISELKMDSITIEQYALLTQLSHTFSLSIYLFFNNKRLHFAMQVATLLGKLAVAPEETVPPGIGTTPESYPGRRPMPAPVTSAQRPVLQQTLPAGVRRNRRETGFPAFGDPGSSSWLRPA